MEKHVRKLTKSNRSYYLIIPAEIVKKYAWREKQKITIEDKGRGELKIKDWRNK
jgi:bifunctional DNA-binding transcriptional regulator/antitoxin component of YhaV-PrlF toxin-antitoxin module